MRITIDKLQQDKHLEAKNESGGSIRLDGSQEIGGLEGGLSPMQLLLAGIGGCSAIDIIGILNKQRQDLKDLRVEVDGNRQSVDTYSEFTTIHLNYIFIGDIEPRKAEKAIKLSLDKYCSVSKALGKTSKITHSYEIQ